MTPLRQRMLEELHRRNYNPDTIRGYILAAEQFAQHFHKSPELMGAEEIAQFQLHLLQEKKLALGTIALRMGALRFLYKKTLKRRDLDFDDLPLLKTPKKLPVVLSPDEVTRLIEAAPNLLYRTILMLLYATGLSRLKKVPSNRHACAAEDLFVAAPNDEIDFQFEEEDAEIVFTGDSPFSGLRLKPGKHKVQDGALAKTYGYSVRWTKNGGGIGNGGGLVQRT